MKVSAIVLCATEREASNFGIFMKETLGLILRWYQNGATYDDEAIHGKMGLSLDLHDDKKRLAHRQFSRPGARVHDGSFEWRVHAIRNSLVVLTKLIDVFPAGRGTADVILVIVEKLTSEDREDIKIMAKRYFALLTKRKNSLVDDRLLRLANTADVEEEDKKNDKDDDKDSDIKRENSTKPVLNRAESQELESGEIVMGKNTSSNNLLSVRTEQRDSERGRGANRNRNSRGGRGGSAEPPHDRRSRVEREESEDRRDSSAEAPRARRLSEERRGHRDHRESSPAAGSNSMNAIETRERSGSASGKHERSPAPRRSRSGDRTEDLKTGALLANVDVSEANRTVEVEEVKEAVEDVEIATRTCSSAVAVAAMIVMNGIREIVAQYTDAKTAIRTRPARNEEPVKSTSSPNPERDAESTKSNRGARQERESEQFAPDVGRTRSRPAEQSEAALRRQLTAEKEAKAKEVQQSVERTRPAARDRTRPPVPSTATASPAGMAPPTGTPTGGARKIVSLVSSSRKREREPASEGETPTGNPPEGKRRRDNNGNGNNGGDQKGGPDDKRKRKNKGGGEGNKGNNHHQQQQQQRVDVKTVVAAMVEITTDAVVKKIVAAMEATEEAVGAIAMTTVEDAGRLGTVDIRHDEDYPRATTEVASKSSLVMALRRLALVFPGQGSQRVGMGKDLLADWPRIVGDVLEEASEATGLSLRRRMMEGPADELTLTHVAQPALLSMSVAVLRVLQHETELPPVHFALGHSLGEYSALVAAGAIEFADAARLVHLRGLAMQRAVAPGVGAMAALMPVRPEDAESLCQEVTVSTGKVCQVANYNSNKQTVISGDAQAVAAVIAQAKATKKGTACYATGQPNIPVVWNVEAEATPKTPEEIAEVMEKQVVHTVRWSDSVDYCVAKEVDHFFELGVGCVLSGLIRQQIGTSDVLTTSCGSADEVKAFLKQSN
ncbi:hypothetical protein PInf_029017 [Phytophthora infestans]|nr:hypothetical protein PInf_029017 [Phytophthora infestans]